MDAFAFVAGALGESSAIVMVARLAEIQRSVNSGVDKVWCCEQGVEGRWC